MQINHLVSIDFLCPPESKSDIICLYFKNINDNELDNGELLITLLKAFKINVSC